MMRKISKGWRIVIVLLILTVLIAVYFLSVITDIIRTSCAEEVRARVINIVNACNDILQALNFFYDDYFIIERNSDGDILAVVANTGLINQINMIMQTEIQERINELRTFTLNMPAGAFTGSVFLSRFGRNIQYRVQTVSNCYTFIASSFTTAGFNQTLHRLVITCVVEIDILVPRKSLAANINNDVVMAENIIVGKVPDTYMGDNFDPNFLDLLPD